MVLQVLNLVYPAPRLSSKELHPWKVILILYSVKKENMLLQVPLKVLT